MSCGREGASIKFHLFHKYGRGWRSNFWKSPYFVQDNFKTPFNRIIGCRIFGHRKVHDGYCFNCYRDVKEKKNDN